MRNVVCWTDKVAVGCEGVEHCETLADAVIDESGDEEDESWGGGQLR